MRPSLPDLEQRDDFIHRHIGPSPADIKAMLETLGLSSLAELTTHAVPASILETAPPVIGEPCTESEALDKIQDIAKKNQIFRSLIGMGYYDTILPPVILRNVLQNPGWYTAYTPYQPEISQGRLEALLNFQHMVMDLTGLPLANASLLDEATAAAEAMTIAKRVSSSSSPRFLVDVNCHPQTIAVLQTRAAPLGIHIVIKDPETFQDQDAFGVLLQYPGTTGKIEDYTGLVKIVRSAGKIVCVAADLLALTVLKPPGEWGADIVIGSAQRFGVPLGFGGPHAAYMATREELKRSIPGRIVGVSVDCHGQPAYRLALQTREQHIRREKATSNICTAQVLLANISAFYAIYHGAEGLRKIAMRTHRLTCLLAAGLKTLGHHIVHDVFFDTITVKPEQGTKKFLQRAHDHRINLRVLDDSLLGISLDERSTRDEVALLWRIFSNKSDHTLAVEQLDQSTPSCLPSSLIRTSAFLTHPTFHLYRSETEMMRYLHRLAQKDIALNRSMIPLGSCTMKLNAAVEMTPITWPEFNAIHPFAPSSQTEGFRLLIEDLEKKLAILTGFSAVSLQPNAGSQGEYAGLLVIRAYHQSRGENSRNICLIPSSAHGTNPATAAMAGMEVVIVACDKNGNIDVSDLHTKATQHATHLACLMVTYPSTHGVYEESIRDICTIIHQHGGQVYMDGANFNALTGLALPGRFGADVMHLNLHKTFCIPHGGGGPGMGPIAVAEHLASFLPGHPVINTSGPQGIGSVSAAPYGSASILPISWLYITLMGTEGLKNATEVAILNANYLAHRLKGHYQTLYSGKSGFVAHECILDTRPFKVSAEVSVDDIAKRLIDFSFHAPTMSFPVPGTLMVEPTESESKAELDRFADALIQIRKEIAAIEQGHYPKDNNPLRNAPHTLQDILQDSWNRPYSRHEACRSPHDKYWPPVGRIDHASGDRQLMCSCPPIMEEQEEKAA